MTFTRLPKTDLWHKLPGFMLGVLFLYFNNALAQPWQVTLTVYNKNLALVQDVRKLKLQKGVSELQFTEVAARIDPTSVHFKSLTAPGRVEILEQNYEFDLVNSQKILQKYINQKVTVLLSEGRSIEGTLLSGSGDIVLETPKGEIRVISTSEVKGFNYPKLPEGLITQPTLVWTVRTDKSATHNVAVEYLTDGISWHAEYVGIVDEKEEHLDLAAWVSLENRCGATYPDAKLKLVAGEVHRVSPPHMPEYRAMKAMAEAAAPIREKEFFEYHLYTVTRKTTIKNNQVKQISLFPSTCIPVQKQYVLDALLWGKAVRVYLKFENRKEVGLGQPLPAGKLRAYKADTDGALVFVGEDRIDHTPVGEKVKVHVGNAFDLKAERKVVHSQKIGSASLEQSIEISLRNHKKEAVKIAVVEHLSYRAPASNWKITSNSHPFKQKDDRTIEFTVMLKPDEEVALTYTVQYTW